MGKYATRKSVRTKKPKTKLGLPDLDHSKAAVLESLRSPESQRGYRHAIDEFIQWYCSEPRLSFRATNGRPAGLSVPADYQQLSAAFDVSLSRQGCPLSN